MKDHTFVSDIATEVIARIQSNGWSVRASRLSSRKCTSRRRTEIMGGVRLHAVKAGEAVVTLHVRDWCQERVEIEAACLLAKRVNVPICEDHDQAVTQAA